MIEEMMKAVKRNNKRRSVNITVGAVVGFLLSCTVAMGAAVEIKGEAGKFTPSITIDENTFENDTYTNNGEILSTDAEGILITGTSTTNKLSIVNNGTINGNTQGINVATGTDITGKIDNNGAVSSTDAEGIKISGKLTAGTDGIAIENNGIIEGKATAISTAANAGVTGDIINNGTIKTKEYGACIDMVAGLLDGKITNKGKVLAAGAGIRSNDAKSELANEGIIDVVGDIAGAGLRLGSTDISAKNIGNTGFIKLKVTGVGERVSSSVGMIVVKTSKDEINKGRIILDSPKIVIGVSADEKTNLISNYGYLDVNSTAESGVGIQVKDATSSNNGITNDGNIRVTGTANSTGIKIKGEAKNTYNFGLINSLTGSGIGIESTATFKKMYNAGIIYGKISAMNIENENFSSNQLTNYGLMITESDDRNKLISGKLAEKFEEGKKFGDLVENYGLAFSVDNTNGSGEKYFLQVIKDETAPGSYKIKNAELNQSTNYDTTGEISGTKNIFSSGFYGEKNKIAMYVINGIDDTLVIDSDEKILENSMVNSYKRALVMGENLKFTTENTRFNGGTDGKSETIYLAGNNVLNLNKGSIVNGNTKIDGTGNTFTMDASIQNGDITADEGSNTISFKNGSIMNGEAAIKGDGNTLEIAAGSFMNGDIAATGAGNNLSLDNSILNGNVAIDGDGNTLNISGEDTFINGDMTAVNGKNTLNLDGKSTDGSSLNMFHEVSGFNNMNITGGSVTFFEDSKVTGLDKVTVAEDGTLNLRLEKTPNPSGSGLGEATHALSGNPGLEIEGLDDGGTLRFITNGIGQGVVINDMSIENMHIGTNSALDGYKFDEKGNLILAVYGSLEDMKQSGDKTISNLLNENTFDNENFDSIDGIYQGIFNSADNTANLEALKDIMHLDRDSEMYNDSVSREEQLTNLQAYLNEVYTQSPYTLSSELSRKSAGMFRDIVVENLFRPNLNQWMIMGGLTHVDGGTKDTYYGEVYQIDDSSSSTTDVDTKLTGAYALGKYGYSENVALGVTVGGNRSEAELSRSKVKGNSGYVGAFAENYRGNLTLKAGAGVQYSEYDADRGTIGGHSYSDKYSDMTYDIYLNGRYSNAVGENLFLEPYATLSYTYVDQDGIDEGNKALAMKTDSKSFDYTAAKVGVDLKKVIPHETGKSTLSAGVSYTKLLSGADADSLRGNFGGSDFDILVASKNEHSLGVNVKYALELQSGILFDVKGSYSFERDSYNGNARNRNKGQWIIGAGLGYKF